MRMPSLKTLREAFGDDAPEARKILKSTRYALAQRPECDALIRGCFGQPSTEQLRFEALGRLPGCHGEEAIRSTGDEYAAYVNVGETYTPTVIKWRGAYRVQSLGDFVEIQERRGVRFD